MFRTMQLCWTFCSTGRPMKAHARRSFRTIPRSCMAFRVGLVGLGMAVTPHAKSLIDLKGRVEVAYAYSPSGERRAQFAKKFPFQTCERLETILEDRTVGAALILTPPHTHLDWSPGLQRREACAPGEAARALDCTCGRTCQNSSDIKLACVLQHRFRPAAEKLHEILLNWEGWYLASAHIPVGGRRAITTSRAAARGRATAAGCCSRREFTRSTFCFHLQEKRRK